jgi:hypothetical protein
VEIEKGVPIPPKMGRPRSESMGIAMSLTIKDSVFVEDFAEANRILASIRALGGRSTRRKMRHEDGRLGWRIWRVK